MPRLAAKPLAIGLNCALGATDMKQYIANLSACADCFVFCYPNAGLPNAMGGYDQKGPEMAEEIRPFCERGWGGWGAIGCWVVWQALDGLLGGVAGPCCSNVAACCWCCGCLLKALLPVLVLLLCVCPTHMLLLCRH